MTGCSSKMLFFYLTLGVGSIFDISSISIIIEHILTHGSYSVFDFKVDEYNNLIRELYDLIFYFENIFKEI